MKKLLITMMALLPLVTMAKSKLSENANPLKSEFICIKKESPWNSLLSLRQ